MKTPKHWNCTDCGIDTAPGGPTLAFIKKPSRGPLKSWDADKTWEVYELQPEVWKAARCRGVLCIGCVEQRIGRKLKPNDFTDGELNRYIGTRRLSTRKGYRGKRTFGFVPRGIGMMIANL
jgi:hypothetical protein